MQLHVHDDVISLSLYLSLSSLFPRPSILTAQLFCAAMSKILVQDSETAWAQMARYQEQIADLEKEVKRLRALLPEDRARGERDKKEE